MPLFPDYVPLMYFVRTCFVQLPRTAPLPSTMKLSLFSNLDSMYSSGITPTASKPSSVRFRDIHDCLYAGKRMVSITHTVLLCSRTDWFRKVERAAGIRSSLPGNRSTMKGYICYTDGSNLPTESKPTIVMCQNLVRYLPAALRITSAGQ